MSPAKLPYWGAAGMRALGERLAELFSSVWEALWGVLVFRSAIATAVLFAVYAVVYWTYLYLTDRRFLAITPFRVWREPPLPFLPEGLAAQLGEELERLQADVREERQHFRSPEKRGGVGYHTLTVEPPAPALVTVEYKGISLDVLNGSLRRLFGRQTVIRGELQPHAEGLAIVCRVAGRGVWEVVTEEGFGSPLRTEMRELAVRVAVGLWPETRYAVANAFAKGVAVALEAGRLEAAWLNARLALLAVDDSPVEHFNLGLVHRRGNRPEDSLAAYSKALRLSEGREAYRSIQLKALNNRALVFADLEQFDEAERDLNRALEIDPSYESARDNLVKLKEERERERERQRFTTRTPRAQGEAEVDSGPEDTEPFLE